MNEKPNFAPDGVPGGVVVKDNPTGFSPKLLAKQEAIAKRVGEISTDPETLARAERFHRKVTRMSAKDLFRKLT